MKNLIELNAENFEEEVIQSDMPVLVDFWAPWCGPCQMLTPIIEELAEDMKGTIKIGKLNTETLENQVLAMTYEIRSIPNMKLFKNGKVIGEFIGLRPKAALKQEIEEALS